MAPASFLRAEVSRADFLDATLQVSFGDELTCNTCTRTVLADLACWGYTMNDALYIETGEVPLTALLVPLGPYRQGGCLCMIPVLR